MQIQFLSFNPDSPARGYWDQALLEDILKNPVVKNVTAENGSIIVIPGAYQSKYINEINQCLQQYDWVVLFITSDEESKFPIEQIVHKNIKIYVQYPKRGRHDAYGKWPLGYTTETRKHVSFGEKTIDVFYSGQNTHERRDLCAKALIKAIDKYDINVNISHNDGFAKGYGQEQYMSLMSRAKVAPSPSGPISADSFRTYEALEAGAVPIADNISPAGDHNYWEYIFGQVPFATLNNYDDLPGYIEDQLNNYPEINNKVMAWWLKKKRDLMWQIIDDIQSLTYYAPGAPVHYHTNQVTAIIPVSPIKSHPSIEILEKTVRSIRTNLTECEIIITFDGVRAEQEHMRDNYNEFIRHALHMCNTEWNAIPILFEHHTHQVGMARVALENVYTPNILYCEQDTPLVTDEPIDWEYLVGEIAYNRANVIRFHFEGVIPKEHNHLMIGEPQDSLLKTVQWSQRPHLASTAFYKHMLRNNFSENAKCFIEDNIHGVIHNDYLEMGMRGWDMWKLFIYYPDPKNIKRSINLDGRDGAEKYDTTQIF